RRTREGLVHADPGLDRTARHEHRDAGTRIDPLADLDLLADADAVEGRAHLDVTEADRQALDGRRGGDDLGLGDGDARGRDGDVALRAAQHDRADRARTARLGRAVRGEVLLGGPQLGALDLDLRAPNAEHRARRV